MTVASRTSADPLGPDSLTWKYFGDLRTGMMGVWIGAIQNMYPELGAGVEEHSILLREPLQRVARSVYPIMGVVYDGDRAAQTGQQIKGYHRTIKGVDAEGRRYHALNPDTFYWAHATFFMLVIKVAEYFCGGLTEAEKHQLFEEHVRWYRMYGMSMRPVPKSWEDFQDYWDRVCRDKLEINQATVDILQMRIPKPRFVLMPTPIWDQLFKPLIAGQRWIAAGLFDPAVREKAGMHWTPGDEVLLRVFGKVVELAFLAVPDEIRLHPRALAAYRRAAGRTRHGRAPGASARLHGATTGSAGAADALLPTPFPSLYPVGSRSRQGPDGTRRGAGPFHTFAGRRAAGAGPQPRCVGPDNQRRPNARALSYRQIAAAAATLRLSAPPDIGMCTRWSAKAAISADNPCASGPNSHAVGSASSRSASSRAISPSTAVASTCSPAARRSAMAAPTSGATTTGIAKMLPVDARRHLPLYGSTLRPARITAAAPMASAMRITVPALPGSRISTVTAIS